MPFIQQTPRAFSRVGIEAIDANQYGVYGILRYDQYGSPVWIYIGKGDIRTRLLCHLNGDKPEILLHGPTHFVGEIHSDPQMSVREKELIALCKGLCNERIG